MAKTYVLTFGTGDPASYTGLSPTLIVFSARGLTSITGPGITETPTGSGFYSFVYGATQPIIFKADGGATLTVATDRYIKGVLDPIQSVDEKMGYTTDSFGSTSVDPASVLGYLKRNQEVLEGNSTYTKSTSVWQVFSRGSSTLLANKTLANTATAATKT